MKIRMAHISPVDYQILERVTPSRIFRSGYKAIYLYKRSVDIYRHKMQVKIIFPYITYALFESARP